MPALSFVLLALRVVNAFPPGSDAGWSHLNGPWFFSDDCRTPECVTTLPFEPAPGAGDNVALYNRNTYREFQAAFELRSRSTDAEAAAGFVFGRAANGSSFLALELPAADQQVARLSRHRADGGRETLARVALPAAAGSVCLSLGRRPAQRVLRLLVLPLRLQTLQALLSLI